MITLETIAKKAGVAPSTVSRVLRNDKGCYLSEEKKENILRISRSLNYIPNFSARNLATGKTNNIAFALCLFSHLDEQRSRNFVMLDRIHSVLEDEGYQLSVVVVNYQDLDELGKVCMNKRLYDGVIFAKNVLPDRGREIFENAAVPLVALDDDNPWLKSITRICSDKLASFVSAIDHLKTLGHERIAFFGFGAHKLIFMKAMEKCGLGFCRELDYELEIKNQQNFSLESYIQSKRLVEEVGKFSAVFCTNDLAAFGLCERLAEHGIEVGRDVSVVGFDNLEGLQGKKEEDCFLTTIHKPLGEIGEKAARLLLWLIKGGEVSNKKHNLSCRLIVRKSTGQFNQKRGV